MWKPPEIPRGTTQRFDCPFCNGSNTFVITNDRGKVLWFCFRDGCHARGATKVRRTTEDMRQELIEKKEEAPAHLKFILPTHFKHIYNYKPGLEWLKSVNCTWAMETGAADIRYDPKLDRVVFVSTYRGATTGATGRAVRKHQIPKWYEYGTSKAPFLCGSSKDGVIVEDPASACAVAATKKVTGIALRGTHMPDEFIPMLLQDFNSITIALDNDASKTAINLHRRLSCLIQNTKVVLLRNDLKYFKPHEIERILHV